MKPILLLLSLILLSGCTTAQVNKSLGYVFPHTNVYGPYRSTYINTTTTIKHSNGTTTTYTTKGYIR